jgi:hypothetical protein
VSGAAQHLVQLLLPRADAGGERFPRLWYDELRAELTARFGGVTAYLRAPAAGAWVDEGAGEVEHDDIVILEVMVGEIDLAWWRALRQRLEHRFRQDEIVVRAHPVQRL